MKPFIILIGAPGSGKGTQSNKLSNLYNFRVISTGDIIRRHISEKTQFSHSLTSFIDKGELVPDKIVYDILSFELKLDKHSNDSEMSSTIFDGFPRTLDQVHFLDDLLGVDNQSIIYFDISKATIIDRLLLRKRSDDHLDIIENRFDIFLSNVQPMLDYYKDRIISIDCNRSPEFIFSDLCSKL